MSQSTRASFAWLASFFVALIALTWTTRAGAQLRCEAGTGTDQSGVLSIATATEQSGRLQNGQASTCAAPKTPPNVLQSTQKFKVDSYTFKNRNLTDTCITVALTTTAGTAQSAAYLGSFDPTNIQTNYLGDSGALSTLNTLTYSITVPALANFVVTVNANSSAAPAATYTVNVKDCGQIVLQSIDPSSGPVAGGTNVTIKGSGFLANPTVTIGGANATNVTLVDEGTITATTPAGTEGPADVVVTNTDTTSATLTGGFTYVPLTGTGISLTSSANPAKFGQSITFTATLKTGAGDAVNGATITFKDGATVLGTGTTNASGIATLNKVLDVGSHDITASFAGDGTYSASTSSVLTQSVVIGATTTTLASSVNPSTVGQSVTFTATVAATAPAVGTPGGTVTFTVDGTASGSPVALDNTGKATLTLSNLAAGAHSIVAAYSGETDKFASSASAPLTQNVSAEAGTDAGSTSSSSGSTTSSSGSTTSSSGGSTSSSSGSTSSSGGADAGGNNASATGDSGGGGCDCSQAEGPISGSGALALFVAVTILARGRRKKR